jgi:hypothetical protein
MPSWMPQRYNEAAPSKFPEYLIATTELAQESCAHTPTGGPRPDDPGQSSVGEVGFDGRAAKVGNVPNS